MPLEKTVSSTNINTDSIQIEQAKTTINAMLLARSTGVTTKGVPTTSTPPESPPSSPTLTKSVSNIEQDLSETFSEVMTLANSSKLLMNKLKGVETESDISVKDIKIPERKSNLTAGFAIVGKPEPESTEKIFYINGYGTERQKCLETTLYVSKMLGDKPVEAIYNPTKGLKGGIRGVVDRLDLGGDSKIIKKVAKGLYEQLVPKEPGVEPKTIKILAHSHGNLVIARALSRIERQLIDEGKNQDEIQLIMSRVKIVGIGSGASRSQFPTGVNYERISNKGDIIPDMMSTNVGGRIENMNHDIHRNKLELNDNIDDFKKKSSLGVLSFAKATCTVGPKIVKGYFKGKCLGLIKNTKIAVRTFGRIDHTMKTLPKLVDQTLGRFLATGNTDSDFLLQEHNVLPTKYGKGYLGDEQNVSRIRNFFGIGETSLIT